MFASTTDANICSGQSTNLNAIGNAATYNWSNGGTGANISVTPTVNTTYVVIGTAANGCITTATQAITVMSNPNITVNSSQPDDMCAGETQILTGGGAVNFQWTASTNGAIFQGNPINISPMATTIYTVIGTDANGCSNKNTIIQNVNQCVGLKENKLNAVSIYPNPTSGVITVALNDNSQKTITVMDVTGRVISSSTDSLEVVNVDLSNLSNGIYYVKIQTAASMQVVKVVKN